MTVKPRKMRSSQSPSHFDIQLEPHEVPGGAGTFGAGEMRWGHGKKGLTLWDKDRQTVTDELAKRVLTRRPG